MEKKLLEILACPICKGELLYDKNRSELICKLDKLAYPVENDIPMLLEEKARRLEEGTE